MLQHVYYGARVSQDDFSFYNFYRECSFSPVFRMDGLVTSYDAIPQEYATFGRGDFRQPSLIVETADGRRVNELRYKEYAILKGRPGLKGLPFLDTDTEDVETLALTMKDNFSGVEVVLYYSVFAEEDIISRYVLVRNTSGEPVQIRSAASLSVDFERADFDFVSLAGAWIRERHISRRPLAPGITSIESRCGSSSHRLNPFAALAAKNADENMGDVYGFSLIYSADFKISAEVDQYDDTRLQVGINPETFSWKLAAGRSLSHRKR